MTSSPTEGRGCYRQIAKAQVAILVTTIIATASLAAGVFSPLTVQALSGSPPWTPDPSNPNGFVAYRDYTVNDNGEYGVDVRLNPNTPIYAPEAGTLLQYQSSGGKCGNWQPGRVVERLGGSPAPLVGFGHIFMTASPGPIQAGQQIGYVANQHDGSSWNCNPLQDSHVEFMYDPSGGGGGYGKGNFVPPTAVKGSAGCPMKDFKWNGAVGVDPCGILATYMKGGEGSLGGLSTATAVAPNGDVTEVSLGPSHSLYAASQIGGSWQTPVGIPGASAYSAPAVVVERNGNIDVLAEGPSNTLYAYWSVFGSGVWHGPGQIGAPGTTFSTPSLTLDYNGNPNAAAEGPQHSLYTYWQISGTWYGPSGTGPVNSTYSAPAEAVDHNHNLNITVQGAANTFDVYWLDGTGWHGPSQLGGTGTTYSSPSMGVDAQGNVTTAVQGPSNTLYIFWSSSGAWYGPNQEAVPGSVYSSPSVAVQPNNGNVNVMVEGPSNTMWLYWSAGSTWYGPAGLGQNQSTYGSPSMVAQPSGNLNAFVEGPSNTLYLYWYIQPQWHGPSQFNGPGTTYSSST